LGGITHVITQGWGSGEELNDQEEKIDDIELARIIEERKKQPEIEVNIENYEFSKAERGWKLVGILTS